MSATNDFTQGSDFISFNFSPPPSPGPSRPRSQSPSRGTSGTSTPRPGNNDQNGDSKSKGGKGKGNDGKKKNDKGKSKANPELDAADESLLAAKNGRRDPAARPGAKPARGKRGIDSVDGDDRDGREDTGPRNLKEERRANERGAPWVYDVNWESCRDPAEMLNEEIRAYYNYVAPTRIEYETRALLIETIVRAVKEIWPDADVTPFGSWQTQLYLPTGDIDLVVSTKLLTQSNKQRLLAELARAMKTRRITDTVAIIGKARVPIIKFVTYEGKINVDISLNQTNGISAGRIINRFLTALPGSRQLIVVVKAFLSQRSMNEVFTGGLGSYAVICLVISFLQVHPKLRRCELDPEQNLGTLLIEFFELYGRNFNYDAVGVSIRQGGFYFDKDRRGWTRPGQRYLLSLEDPQDADNDITTGSFGIRQVRATFSGAYEMLQAKLFERAEQISGKKSGRYTAAWDPEEMSILTAIMGVTKETIKHRAGLRQLHSDERLQRQLRIPKGKDPMTFLSYDQPEGYHSVDTDTPGPSTTSRRKEESAPAPYDSRRGGEGVQAIMVDDGEVGEMESDSESDAEERILNGGRANTHSNGTSSKARVKRTKLDATVVDSDDSEYGQALKQILASNDLSDAEEGEIVEVFPDGASRARNLSVSEDDVPSGTGTLDGESRYALGRGKAKGKAKASLLGGNGKRKADNGGALAKPASSSGSDSDDSSDDSIVAIDPPKDYKAKPTPESKSKAKAKAKASDRKAFWNAKGVVAQVISSDED